MSSYVLKILLPEKKIYDGEVTSIMATCEDGPLTVLAGHAPMTAMLVEGPLVVKTEQEVLEGIAGRGVLQVARNEAVLMVHSFKWDGDAAEDVISQASGNDMML